MFGYDFDADLNALAGGQLQSLALAAHNKPRCLSGADKSLAILLNMLSHRVHEADLLSLYTIGMPLFADRVGAGSAPA